MTENLDLINSNFFWLCYEQVIPFELEESFYWYLNSTGINRFSFECDPQNIATKTLRIWLPLNECSDIQQANLAKELDSLSKTFELILRAHYI